MAEIQRKYIIPLRKAYRKAPIYRRTRRATNALREFVQKHMKVETVKIGKYLNLYIWKNGPRNPPHKVEVDIIKIEEKDKEPYAKVELVNAPKEEKKNIKKKKSFVSQLKEKITEAPKEEKMEEKKEEPVKDASEKESKKKELEKEKKEVLEKKAPEAPKEAKQKEAKKDPTPEVQEQSRQDKIVSLPRKK
ncbi:MAG: 50S ribosomal protein L31e [archaeon]